ncbi:MAG: cell division protein ZapA [Gammaproteobacteria bacterium]|nr:MAG: cell division protein ZapA [Gammaproteobacteria bacterium]
MPESTPITVLILEKEYRINCPGKEHEALMKSAQFLDGKMREIRDTGKIIGIDRIAVIAALNIINEMLQNESQVSEQSRSVSSHIRSLEDKIDTALSRNRQLEL